MIQSTISAVRSIDRTLENSTMIDERALISALFRDRDHIILDQKRFVLSYQRDEILYADHSSTEADQLLWNTLTIQLCSARFTDDFKSVESLLITVMSVFKTICDESNSWYGLVPVQPPAPFPLTEIFTYTSCVSVLHMSTNLTKQWD